VPATRFLLDGNIYNLLETEPEVRSQIGALTESGRVEIVASPAVVTELQRSPFRGVPSWFEVVVQPEGIAISGLARSGMARSSGGAIYRQHLGESQQGFDAIIAHSAHSMGATLVSEDHRCRERLKKFAGTGGAMTYSEFKAWLHQTIVEQQSHVAAQQPLAAVGAWCDREALRLKR
jgi:hypothetical protein